MNMQKKLYRLIFFRTVYIRKRQVWQGDKGKKDGRTLKNKMKLSKSSPLAEFVGIK